MEDRQFKTHPEESVLSLLLELLLWKNSQDFYSSWPLIWGLSLY